MAFDRVFGKFVVKKPLKDMIFDLFGDVNMIATTLRRFSSPTLTNPNSPVRMFVLRKNDE